MTSDYVNDYKTVVQIRKELGMTQQEFCDRFHVPMHRLKKWEYCEKQTPDYAVYLIRRVIELEEKYEPWRQ